MSLEENTPQEGVNELDLISDLRNPEPAAEPVAEPAETPVTEEPPIDDEKEAESKREALLREIAMDPGLTQQYATQQAQPAQQEQAIELPFDEFTFDAGNPQHMQALLDARLAEVGGPLFDKLDKIAQRFEQEEQIKQQQQFEQAAEHANKKTVEFLDTYVPGFNDIAQKFMGDQVITPVEEAVFNKAVNLESAMFQSFAQQLAMQHQVHPAQAYNFVTNNVQIRAQIAQQIGPEIKKYAQALGLVAQPKPAITPEQKQVMKQESYVESSNAVPANTVTSFEKALASGNELQMIQALRQK